MTTEQKRYAEGDACPECKQPLLFLNATHGNQLEPSQQAVTWCTDCGLEFPVDWGRQSRVNGLTDVWLSPLYAGSDGMKCAKCRSVTWCVWMNHEELSRLPADSYGYCSMTGAITNIASEAALMICHEKLGLVLCVDCAKKLCRFCNKPATCYGTYEGMTGFACDDCCGHGCEDGHCEPVTQGDANADTR